MNPTKPRNRVLAAMMSLVLALGLMPLPAYAASTSENLGGGASELALTPASADMTAQTADGYIYVPSGTNTSASGANAGTYPGCSVLGNSAYKNLFTEQLYLQTELGSTERVITHVAFYFMNSAARTYTAKTFKIYMGATTVSSISAVSGIIAADQMTLVYDSPTTITTINSSGGSWVDFELSEPFFYDGQSNLAVAIVATADADAGGLINTANQSNENKGWMYVSDTTPEAFASYSAARTAAASATLNKYNAAYKNRPSIRLGYSNTPITSYGITKSASTNGNYTVTVNGSAVESAAASATVAITPTANDGYAVDTVTVKDSDNNAVETTKSGNAYTFSMPAKNVTISVTFKAGSAEVEDTFAVDNPQKVNGSYVISTKADLMKLAERVNTSGTNATYKGESYVLAADIDLSGEEWVAIGASSSAHFNGSFNGQGHAITNMTTSSITSSNTVKCGGLFGYVSLGSGLNDVTIENLKVKGSITSTAASASSNLAGGLVGHAAGTNKRLTIRNCVVDVDVDCTGGAGGLVGNAPKFLTIENCLVLGDLINAGVCVGGFVGAQGSYNAGDTIISNSVYAGQITTGSSFSTQTQDNSKNAVNGLMGRSYSGTVAGTLFKSTYYLEQTDTNVKTFRPSNNASDSYAAIEEVGLIIPAAANSRYTSGTTAFATAANTLKDAGWKVDGNSIAPKPFEASEGYTYPAATKTKSAITAGGTASEGVYSVSGGSYTVTVSGSNVTEAEEGATVTITADPQNGYELKSVTVTDADGAVEVSGTGSTRTFTMPAKAVTVAVTFEVPTSTVDVPTAVQGLKYNGSAQTVVAAGTGYTLTFAEGSPDDAALDESKNATLTNATASDVTVIATLAEGYTWTGGETGNKTITVSMGKGDNPAVSVNPTAVSLVTGGSAGTSTVTYTGTGALSAASEDTAIATAELNSNTVTITPVAAGTTKVTVTAAADSNYEANSTAEIAVTVVDASALTLYAQPMTKDSALEAGATYILTSRNATSGTTYAVMGVNGTTQSVRNAAYDEDAGTFTFASVADKTESTWIAEESGSNFKFKTSGGKYLNIAATTLGINDSGVVVAWRGNHNGSNDFSTIRTIAALYNNMYGMVQYASGAFKYQLSADSSKDSAKVWKVSDTPFPAYYDVTFVAENGTTVLQAATKYAEGTKGSDITKPTDPTKDATAEYTYTFDGWYDGDNKLTDATEITGDVTFKAKYTETKNKYTVTFVDEDGTTELKAATEYDYGTAWADVAKPDNPTKADKDGYSFAFAEWKDAPATLTAAVTVKASYTKTAIPYTITYSGVEGATNPNSAISYTVESDDITLAAPSKEGYVFEGWTGAGLTEATKSVVIGKGSTGNREYTATWSAVEPDDPEQPETTKTDDETGVVASLPSAKDVIEKPEEQELKLTVENESDDDEAVQGVVEGFAQLAEAEIEGAEEAKADIAAAAEGGRAFVFDVELAVVNKADGQTVKELTEPADLGNQKLTLKFPVGEEFAGMTANVYQVHENADNSVELLAYAGKTVADDGTVTVEVEKLSVFTIAVELSKADLTAAIAAAKNDLDGTAIATSAADVDKGKKFVLQADADKLKAAIAEAEGALSEADTQAELDAAKDKMLAATAAFDAAKKDGTKEASQGQGDGKTDGKSDEKPAVATQVMYRLYNPNSGEHFYTASAAERDKVRDAGWRYEGEAWTAPVKSNTPVYRVYSGTDHHYTTDKAERDWLVNDIGWKDEGIGWYSDDAEGVALYRLYNPNVDPSAPVNNSGSHHYTVSASERDFLIGIGWVDEKIAWYGVKK